MQNVSLSATNVIKITLNMSTKNVYFGQIL